MRLTLRQLDVFVTVARLESVSRAAARLSLSQSAASSALMELERQQGCLLFDRLGRKLRLNAMGRGLLPMAEDVLLRSRAIEGYLGGEGLPPLAVGATLTVGNYLGTLAVADYLQQHPEAAIALQVGNTGQIIERLLTGQVDIALVEGEASASGLSFTPWLEDELVVFCAPGHPLAASCHLRSTDFGAEKWIVREIGSGTRARFDEAMRAIGVEPQVTLVLEHTEAIKRAVECGIGIGCLSRLALRDAFRRGSLVEVKTPELRLSRRFYFVQHRERPLSASAEAFLACCRTLSGPAVNTDELVLPLIP